MATTAPLPDASSESALLRNENIERLSRRVAMYVTRPRSVSRGDAEQDAAIILIEMRERWDDAQAAHLPVDRQENMAVAWARLRLIDKYETEFARQRVTHSIEGGISGRTDRE